MKKTGIAVIILLVITILAVSGTTFAFFSAGSVDFEIYVEGQVGSVLAIDLFANQGTDIRPAQTTAQNNVYTAKSEDSGDMAIFVLKYVSRSIEAIDVEYTITDVKYVSGGATWATNNPYSLYLNDSIEYTFEMLQTQTAPTQETIPTPTKTWVKAGSGNNTFTAIPQGTGYLICYVRINKTDELVPPACRGAKLQFTISTAISTTQIAP